MINFHAFSDELQKIAKEKAIYDAGVVAHEAGHAQVLQNRAWSVGSRAVPAAASLYGTARMASMMAGAPGMGTGEFTAVSALRNVPVLANEASASVVGMQKAEKKLTKEDWRRAAMRLAAINSSYLAGPAVDIATLGAARAGLHPLAQIGLQAALRPLASGAWGALAMKATSGPKVTEQGAKKIVEAVAPKGTPVFVIKEPIPGGAQYVPKPSSDLEKGIVEGQYSKVMTKRDLSTLKGRGGVLIAPLDAEAHLRSSIPFSGPAQLKTKFKRVK